MSTAAKIIEWLEEQPSDAEIRCRTSADGSGEWAALDAVTVDEVEFANYDGLALLVASPWEEPDEERMDPHFAVFNLHVNDAGKRADTEFKKQFGEKAWEEHIALRHEEGIMSIFNEPPTVETSAWVALVTAYVNEDRS